MSTPSLCPIRQASSMESVPVISILPLSSQCTLWACSVQQVCSLCLVPCARGPSSAQGSRGTSQEGRDLLSGSGVQPPAALGFHQLLSEGFCGSISGATLPHKQLPPSTLEGRFRASSRGLASNQFCWHHGKSSVPSPARSACPLEGSLFLCALCCFPQL